MAEGEPVRIFTRRDLLKGAGMVAAAAVTLPADLVTTADAAGAEPQAAQAAAASRAREAFETLTATESDVLEAIVGRLIPSDALGPGATRSPVRSPGRGPPTRPASPRSIATRDRREARRSSSSRQPTRIRY